MAARRANMDAGVRSLAALPIVGGGEVVAMLERQSAEADHFDDQEIQLLTELAGDIGFAVQTIEKQERLDYLAYYDPLTGLPNRALFMERAARRLAGNDEEERALCLVLLNIERFRNVNETLGRRGGDELLKQVAARLEGAFAGKESLSRLGADGFGVLLAGVRDRSSATQVIERKIQDSFNEAFSVMGHDMHLSVRAGAAMSPADGTDADALFRNAEAALKSTMESHEPCLFYSAAMNARAAQALSLEMKLRRAVECGQLVMHYQPKYRLDDKSICGLEASALALGSWFPIRTVAWALGALWVTAAAIGAHGAARADLLESYAAFRPEGQVTLLALSLVAGAVVAVRRDSFDHIEIGRT
jgi:diguanylate cyclase (GGDEF)-like protein